MKLNEKYLKLKETLKDLNKIAIAFSGGVDSTFLAKVGKEILNENAIAITVIAPMHPSKEIEEAKKLAKEIGIKHILIELEMSAIDAIENNPPDRCYVCKKRVFSEIIKEAKKYGIHNVLDGSNIDDLSDYRPGMKAIDELKVVSPLKIASLTKEDIRILSKELNLNTWNKPSFSCLVTRFPYFEKLTLEKLNIVEKAEDILRQHGFRQFRLRHHGEIARIEIGRDERVKLFDLDKLDILSKEIKSLGYKYVAMELEGYSMGNMNKTLSIDEEV